MRILALDQSSRLNGYSIFDGEKLIKYGKISLNDQDLGLRLVKLRKEIKELIQEYKIEKVYFEDIQMQNNVVNNVGTFKALAEVFGVVEELLAEIGISHETIPSVTWKSKLGIKGRTRPEQKKAAQEYVLSTFGVKATQDEVDAICIGACGQSQSDILDWSD